MANNWNNLVKGSSMRQKLQNSKGYAESPEFLPVLGLFIQEEVCRYNEVNEIHSLLDYIFLYTHLYIYTWTPT